MSFALREAFQCNCVEKDLEDGLIKRDTFGCDTWFLVAAMLSSRLRDYNNRHRYFHINHDRLHLQPNSDAI